MPEFFPKISIVMISYNHEKYIAQALNGVLMQKLESPVEVIISDDNSKDFTQNIIRNILKNYHGEFDIKFFSQNINLGIIKNFMFTLNQCQGEYIAICEGDDYWVDDQKLAKQIKLLDEKIYLAGTFHYVRKEYEGMPYLTGIFQKDVPDILTTNDLIASSSLMHTSSLVFRREALQFPYWYGTMLSGDFALSSILSAYGPFQKIKDVMSVYRINNQGVTNSDFYNSNIFDLKINILKKLNEFHQFKFNDSFEKVIKEILVQSKRKPNFIQRIRRRVKLGLILKKTLYYFKFN